MRSWSISVEQENWQVREDISRWTQVLIIQYNKFLSHLMQQDLPSESTCRIATSSLSLSWMHSLCCHGCCKTGPFSHGVVDVIVWVNCMCFWLFCGMSEFRLSSEMSFMTDKGWGQTHSLEMGSTSVLPPFNHPVFLTFWLVDRNQKREM